MSTKYSGPNQTKGDVKEKDKSNDIDPRELDKAGNAGAGEKAPGQAKGHDKDKAQGEAKGHDKAEAKVQPLKEGEHLPGDFRARVENTAAGDLNQDPRTPYPVGNPPDPRESFFRMNGYYQEDKDQGPGGKRTKADQLDADPKT
jgi:hypothetical protein